MGSVAIAAGTAAAMFVGTNLDDFVVLAVLNASSNAGGRPRRWQIWVGQYAGVAGLVIVSLLAALGLTVVPARWIWVLGLLPLGLGVYKLAAAIRAHRDAAEPPTASAGGLWGVVGLTLANGGDNLAAYPPFFRALDAGGLAVTMLVFAVGVAFWCALGALLVTHRRVTDAVRGWGHWIIPVVYLLIGLYVMYKGGLLPQ